MGLPALVLSVVLTQAPVRDVPWGFTSTGASAAATFVSVSAGVFVQVVPILVDGRPQPLVTPLALSVALALNVGLTHLALPWLAGRLGGSDAPAAAIRESAWRHARWAFLGGGLGVVTIGVGSALEESAFGRGQGVMVTGLLITVAAMLAWDVLEAVGSWAVAR